MWSGQHGLETSLPEAATYVSSSLRWYVKGLLSHGVGMFSGTKHRSRQKPVLSKTSSTITPDKQQSCPAQLKVSVVDKQTIGKFRMPCPPNQISASVCKFNKL